RRRLELNIDLLLEEIGCSLIAIPRGFDPELDAEVVEADANSCRRDPGDRKNLHRVPGQFRVAEPCSERNVTHVSHRVADVIPALTSRLVGPTRQPNRPKPHLQESPSGRASL